MPKLSAIKAISRPIDVSIPSLGDVIIKVRYFPGKFTPELENRLDQMFKETDAAVLQSEMAQAIDQDQTLTEEQRAKRKDDVAKLKNYVVSLMVELLDSWDITDDAEIPLPIEPESLASVPYVILKHVFRDITADMAPKETN